jgi:hypothetical protein
LTRRSTLSGSATEHRARVADVAAESGDNFNPIAGLFGAERLSFVQCMEHTRLNLDEPKDALRVHMNSARRMSRNLILRALKDGRPEVLNEDQICSIYMYTAPSPFYRILNALLRDKQRAGLKPFAPYLRLFIGALHALPERATHVYRGVKRNLVGRCFGKSSL